MNIKLAKPSSLPSSVTFYIQAGSRIGLGHLARSAAVIRGLAKSGVTTQIRLDADALGHEEATALGFDGKSYSPSGSGPLIIDALSIPDTASNWLAEFSPRILISPVCNRADLATHVLVREAPDKLREELPEQSELIIDPAFAFVTAGGLTPQSRDYASLTLGICLSGGDDKFNLNGLLCELSQVPELSEIRLLDRRNPDSLPENGPKLLHAKANRNPWTFLGAANVFLGGEGVMLAEAIAQGIPAISLSTTGESGKNMTLAKTGTLKIIPRNPFEPTQLIALLSNRNLLTEMHKAAMHSVDQVYPGALVQRILDLLTAGGYPK